MASHTILIICLSIALVMALAANAKMLRLQRHGFAKRAQPDAKHMASEALRQLNCEVDWSKDDERDIGRYTYQSGHFNVSMEKGNPYLRLSYLFFFETDIAEIEQVRTVCNLCNLNSDTARIVYSLDDKNAKVALHVINVFPIAANGMKDELQRSMAEAFRWQNAYLAKYMELGNENDKKHVTDNEKANAQHARSLQLIRKQEMTHQDAGPDCHETAESRTELRSLLSTAMGLTDIVPIRLTLAIGDKLTVMDNPDDILAYRVSAPIINGSTVSNESATGRLDFYDPRDPVTPRHLTLDFEHEESDADTLYYRVTMTLTPMSISNTVNKDSERHSKQTTSVLLGLDLTPAQERIAHFRYVWKEAMGKLQNGDTKDMSDEEKVIAATHDSRLAYNYHIGRSLYLQARYHEALLPLGDAFRETAKRHNNARDRNTTETLNELAYLIGCCHMALHQYDRACYYLQLTLPTTHRSYSEAYINCLVNGNDHRALDILNGLLGSFQMMNEQAANEEENDANSQTIPEKEQMADFINFIKRRKAYLLVSLQRYDEAERLLKQLLDDPANSDFALNELAYIQKSRLRNKKTRE